jgi:hypothetical protein
MKYEYRVSMSFLPERLQNIIIWILLNLVWIGVALVSLIPIPVGDSPGNSEWSKYFQITQSSGHHYIRIERGIRYSIDRYRDWSTYLYLTLLHFWIGNLDTRFNIRDKQTRRILLIPFFVIPIFGILGRVNGMQTSLSPRLFTGVQIVSWIVYGFTFIFWLLVVRKNLKYSIVYGDSAYYLVSIIGLTVFYTSLYCLYFSGNQSIETNLHIHHWWIASITCFLLHYNFYYNNVAFLVFYSIYLQGLVSFGAVSIFLDS